MSATRQFMTIALAQDKTKRGDRFWRVVDKVSGRPLSPPIWSGEIEWFVESFEEISLGLAAAHFFPSREPIHWQVGYTVFMRWFCCWPIQIRNLTFRSNGGKVPGWRRPARRSVYDDISARRTGLHLAAFRWLWAGWNNCENWPATFGRTHQPSANI